MAETASSGRECGLFGAPPIEGLWNNVAPLGAFGIDIHGKESRAPPGATPIA
jgi:hypothetical protein